MDIVIAPFLFVLGAVAASFLTVVSERLHTGSSWVTGRSKCNSCNRTLDAIDVIPVASWLFFLGRCRTCRSKIPFSYIVFEILLGSVFALSYVVLGLSLPLLVFLVCVALLGLIVLYDLRHTVILLSVLGCLLALSLLFAVLTSTTLLSLGVTLIYASLAGLFLFALHIFSKGRAMGLGDAPLTFALSCMVGEYAVSGLLFSFWIGAAIGILLLVFSRGRTTMKTEVPFAPFLALGFLLAFFLQWNPFLVPLL